MARIFSISNQKGGVGKTTTAVNLAASLAAAEKKTLLIDMDAQANATSNVGVDPYEKADRQVYQILLEQKSVEDVLEKTELSFLDLLPAGADLIGFEVEGLELERREFKLREALEKTKHHYDYIVIDCPPSLSLLTLNALVAADGLIVPLQCEYFALEGLGRLMQTMELVQARLNPNLSLDGIVLTMFDRRNRLSFRVANEVEEHFGEKVFSTRIPRNVRLSESPSFGKPILLYDIRSPGAQRYLGLAKEVIERFPTEGSSKSEKVSPVGGRYEREKSVGERPVVPHPSAEPWPV